MGCQGRRGTLRVLCTMLLGALVWASPAAANSIAVNDVQVTEGPGTVDATFAVTRDAGLLSGSTSVSYRTADGSATSPADYLATSGTLSFGSALLGATQTQYVTVAVAPDTLDEDTESFHLVIAGEEVTDGDGVGTILDDDPTPSLSVADSPAVSEGTAGARATFVIRLSAVSGRDVSVAFATANGSATAGQDYTARSGTLVIPAGSASGSIAVAILDDAVVEPTESFQLRLSSPQNATLANATASATILDDDVPPAPPPPPPPVVAPGGQTSIPLPVLGSTSVPGTKTSTKPATTTGSSTSSRPALGLSSPRLQRPATVLVTISCPQSTTRCSGQVTIFSIANVHSKIKALRKQRKLGLRKFTLAGGHSRTLSLAVGKTDRSLLNRTGRMRVRAYAVTQDAAGRTGVRSVNGTLIARTAHSGF
ncbi:MAG TPA: Calx-beta domain-containing protein [Solirubrobacteraceae bacterium]|nr:Calx-beta domain-containing protein [Solirubrobacteraceae bacterium]